MWGRKLKCRQFLVNLVEGNCKAMEITTYEEWEDSVHEKVKTEPSWAFLGYRKALFLYDLAWKDCEKLLKDKRGQAIAEQLIRSVGSISANLEEGHGRGYGKQRDWFFRVALGSARESKGWYWKSHHLLSTSVLDHRLALADEVIALTVAELSHQKNFRRSSPKSINRWIIESLNHYGFCSTNFFKLFCAPAVDRAAFILFSQA